MKYYSETLNKLFDTEEEIMQAEKAYEEKNLEEKKAKEERKADSKKVSDAYKAYLEAGKKYEDELNTFIKKYGSYHATYTNVEDKPISAVDLVKSIFNSFNRLYF